MEKPTKKQLQEIIKKQEEDLARYKKGFQDVVAAHKCLLKEKEALEISLKVMSRNTNSEVPNISGIESPECSSPAKKSETESEAGNETENKTEEPETIDELKSQLSMLMQSLATLSEEKSRMEASFQADKKVLRYEKEERENVIKDLQRQLDQVNKSHQSEIENFKSKLIIERHQREKEHHDHGVMIRELQKLLSEERITREKSENSCEDIQRELLSVRSIAERKEKELANQVEVLRRKLHCEKDTSGPMLASLQQEMTVMKHQHTIAIQREQERAAEAEERTKKLAAMHEERVANLEARLADLSQTVGSYDRLRQEDLQAIFKLKERLVQLEMEHGDEKEKADVNMDVLIDRLKHVKSLIEDANRTSEKPVDVYSVLLDSNESTTLSRYTNSDHTLCNEDYQMLKQEFETYKQQMQSSQHSRSPKNENFSQVESFKLQIKKLKDKVHSLQNQLDNSAKNSKEKQEEFQNVLKNERLKWQEKLSASEVDQRIRLADMEHQLAKQRERALALVQEKDEEILSLKASFQSFLPSPNTRLSTSSDKDSDTTHQVSIDLSEGRPMLYYVQEISRLQVDIAKLRKQKHRLEAMVRDTQFAAAEEKETLNSRISNLTEEVGRLERCQTREGANLEYLKNVVLSYLLTSDDKSKSHMLNAISVVLQFSDSEKIKVSNITNHRIPSNPANK